MVRPVPLHTILVKHACRDWPCVYNRAFFALSTQPKPVGFNFYRSSAPAFVRRLPPRYSQALPPTCQIIQLLPFALCIALPECVTDHLATLLTLALIFAMYVTTNVAKKNPVLLITAILGLFYEVLNCLLPFCYLGSTSCRIDILFISRPVSPAIKCVQNLSSESFGKSAHGTSCGSRRRPPGLPALPCR